MRAPVKTRETLPASPELTGTSIIAGASSRRDLTLRKPPEAGARHVPATGHRRHVDYSAHAKLIVSGESADNRAVPALSRLP